MGMQESNVRPPATPNTLLETGAFIVEMSLFQSAGINRNIPTGSDHTCKYLLLANHQSSILTYSTSMQTKVKKTPPGTKKQQQVLPDKINANPRTD